MGNVKRFQEKKSSVEKRVYILCQEGSSNGILRAFDAVFGTELADGGVNNGTLRDGELVIEVAAFGEDLGKECQEFIRKQINTVCGRFALVETEHLDVKINALHQLNGSKGFAALKYSYPGKRDEEAESAILTPLFEVLSKVRGLLLADGGSRLLNEDGKLVLSDGGESEFEWFMPYERPLPKDFFAGAPQDALRRRNQSLESIRARHIHVTEWLPLIESEQDAHFRSAREIAGRAAALMIVALYSELLLSEQETTQKAREFIQPIVECYGAGAFFSPKERAYLEDDNSTEQDRVQFVWQYEPLLVMLWALGYEEELSFPDRICDVAALVRTMREHDSIQALLEQARPRGGDELLCAADLTYRLDWACVDARIHGLPAPGGMDGGVVMERHKALNWLVCGDDWDEVDIST